MQLSLRTDRSLLRAEAHSTRYLMVALTAPMAPPRANRLPVNVGIVLDRSGSMDGERKFDIARQAVEESLRMLRPEDHFTLVVYDTEVDTLVASTLATPEAKRLALRRLNDVEPRGGTDLHAGWVTGAGEIAGRLSADSVNRVLLITDGLANAGVMEPLALALQAAEFRRCGMATSTFGVGEDFDERLLRDIAHEGGGNFYFIETPRQIPDLLTSELGEALEVVVRDAALQITLPAGAEAKPLNRNRFVRVPGDNELRVELGDLASGQELQVVLRIRFGTGQPNDTVAVGVALTDRSSITQEHAVQVTWRYSDHAENDAQPRDRMVDREVAVLYAARARAEATEANRAGDYQRARRVLERTASRIRGYANGDPELEGLWRTLLTEVEMFSERPMSAMELKSSFFVAESVAMNRAPDGKARRSRPARS